jgi:hypothetical protein
MSDINRQAAEAIGWSPSVAIGLPTHGFSPLCGPVSQLAMAESLAKCPDYDTDLNAAWEALERCGFWSHFYLAKMNDDCYAIHARREGEDAWRRFPISDTPALAICNAILEASKST